MTLHHYTHTHTYIHHNGEIVDRCIYNEEWHEWNYQKQPVEKVQDKSELHTNVYLHNDGILVIIIS